MRNFLRRIFGKEPSLSWPKPVLALSPEEEVVMKQISLECQEYGYKGLLGWVQTQGHTMAEQLSRTKLNHSHPPLTLEIGCGSGYHFRFVKPQRYYGLDYDFVRLRRARCRWPEFPLVQGDAYSLPFSSDTFDRVVSIYTFEHLNRLPECLAEVRRVMKRGGELLVGLPAEGGWTYELGRRLTTKRYVERKYKVDYLRLIRSEHCCTCGEVIEELRKWFIVKTVRYLPLMLPLVHLNAIVVLRCVSHSPQNIS